MSATLQPWRKFKPDQDDSPYGWIQFKGSNICMDFHCKCGAHGHIDADFAYAVKCGACGQVYEMSGHVEARPIDEKDWIGCAPRVADVSD
jgi:hypothetical protein